MVEENRSPWFRLKNIDETRNYLIEEINQSELMSKKHKKVCTTLNYIEHFLILASTITRCVSISAFASLIGILIGITSSVIGLKICARIKKYIKKSITKEKKKNRDKRVLWAKSKLNSIEVLISKPLIDSNINHDEFVLINNVRKEYDDMKKEIKNLKTSTVCRRFSSIYKALLLYCLKCIKKEGQKQEENGFIKMYSLW